MDKKKEIINILKKGDELTKSRISALISSNLYKAEELLEELKKEGKVKETITKKGVFWGLKKGEKTK